jgi:carbon starvation protein CstA
MILLTTDKLGEDSPITIIFVILSVVGIIDIVNEMIEDYRDVLSKNYMKKILLFAALYMKTRSIYISSIVSIVVVLLFNKVFFGPQTGPKP